MEIINRQAYSDCIRPFIDKNVIKVLTGQRRVGKSCILQQIAGEIRAEQPEANIIFINMEFREFRHLRTDEAMFDYLEDKLRTDRKNYLFIDEVQEIEGFENVLRSVQAKEQADIFITGSNAKMLSGELATYLSGRYVEFHIHSLSYEEFLLFHRLSDDDNALRLYLTYGGMPYLANLPLEDDMAFEYLRNIYATIILKDVVSRERIRNVDFLDSLLTYTADNVGNLFSAGNISRYLKSQHVNISPLVVINYLHALANAFIINKVERVDVAGLKKFEIGNKYYFEDLGLRNCRLSFNYARDIGRLMENAVYLHLRRLSYDVYVGRVGQQEVDFVGIKGGRRIYVQVAYLIADEQTRKREFGNLQAIADNYPKYVVSLDPLLSASDINGIKHLHMREFLKIEKLKD